MSCCAMLNKRERMAGRLPKGAAGLAQENHSKQSSGTAWTPPYPVSIAQPAYIVKWQVSDATPRQERGVRTCRKIPITEST